MKLLAVIDMQNDFIDGALGTKEAQAIVAAVSKRIREYKARGDAVVFTRDTHGADYLSTQEGRRLPVAHCVRGTAGWEISRALDTSGAKIIDKPSFGSLELARYAQSLADLDGIELAGLCTDICVISNAMILKAALPEVPVAVNASCCAGVTPQSHRTALDAMRACQIDIL